MKAGSETPAILLPGTASVAGRKGEIVRVYRRPDDIEHGACPKSTEFPSGLARGSFTD
jgi:hypothetical protein